MRVVGYSRTGRYEHDTAYCDSFPFQKIQKISITPYHRCIDLTWSVLVLDFSTRLLDSSLKYITEYKLVSFLRALQR